jgi:glycosyltransferase involved in cell wall biosynthesis
MENEKKRVALIHDFLVSYGGAERVLEDLAALYPEAPIYTLLFDKERMGEHFSGRDVRPSWLQNLPSFLRRHYRWLLPLFPSAVESFDLREFDLVISSSGAWSKGIVTRLNTKHIAYLHSPMRYAWDYHEEYVKELGGKSRRNIFTRLLVSYLRLWDKQAAERPDVLLANSAFTAARVNKYYRREAAVVYPSALSLSERHKDTAYDQEKREYFLIVSRLTRSKKTEAVVEAFNKLSLPLVIAGTGPEEKRLKKIAGDHIRFTGFVSDEALVRLYQGARALIFPSEEDFGMVAVEALSFGVPVIALEYGGIKEIVRSEETGEFFHSNAPEIIAEGVRRFLTHEGQYSTEQMKASVSCFSTKNFQEGIENAVKSITE